MKLPVNELFETIQGEATWTGTPSIFVRLQGCAVGCPWCDTKHTWELDPTFEVAFEQILAKTLDAPTYSRVDVKELSDTIKRLPSRHVVITGGEPCIYDLEPLIDALDGQKTVQVETSGTQPIRAKAAWVTVSPKIDMPGGFKLDPEALARADEIKMPVGKWDDVTKLIGLFGPYPCSKKIWLQPLSTSEKATKICIAAAVMHGFKVSLQTHKYAGLR